LTFETKLALSSVALALACAPNLGPSGSLVNGPRVLAVRGNPPEALPGGPSGGTIAYDLLAVTPQGRVAAPPVAWDYCTTPRPPSTNNVIGPDCFDGGVQSLGALAPTAQAKMPQNACSIYGPDQPPPMKGQPPARPPDPDGTGGYYQPLLLTVPFPSSLDGGIYQAAGLERVQCNLPNAPLSVSEQYNSKDGGYTRNQNPVLEQVTARLDGGSDTVLMGAIDGGAAVPFAVPIGGTVWLSASWPASSVESFPVFDLTTRQLVTQREILTLAWYVTAGAMHFDLVARTPDNPSTVGDNQWVAPSSAQLVHMWLVLRDDRGGVDFGEYAFDVR
jgi:hypothetical protein